MPKRERNPGILSRFLNKGAVKKGAGPVRRFIGAKGVAAE
jgi:hypothetical protein